MKKTDCQLLGVLTKPHGYKGDVILSCTNSLPEDILKWESVFIETDGLLVPFFIDDCILTHADTAVIRFEDYTNIELIREFLHCQVYIPKTFVKKKRSVSFEITDLEGYTVIDRHFGDLGIVEEILDYSQNIVFRITKEKQEVMVPVHDSIVENIDTRKKIIFINAPEGLIDLYLEDPNQ